jgi:hypothetical protein
MQGSSARARHRTEVLSDADLELVAFGDDVVTGRQVDFCRDATVPFLQRPDYEVRGETPAQVFVPPPFQSPFMVRSSAPPAPELLPEPPAVATPRAPTSIPPPPDPSIRGYLFVCTAATLLGIIVLFFQLN